MRRRYLGIAVVVALGSGACFLGVHKCAQRYAYAVNVASSLIMYPVLCAQARIVMPVQNWLAERKTIKKLRAERDALRAERDELRANNVQLYATVAHSKDIRELTSFKKRYQHKNAPIARILARYFADDEQYYLIDGGSRSGIKPDMVAVYQNALVGRVCQVYPWYSKVCLITDQSCKVAARSANSKITGIHEGCNQEGVSRLSYVSHLDEVHEGELLLSSGEGLVFPEGFALGTVVRAAPSQLYHEIEVKPACDVKALTHCMIVDRAELPS